MEMIIKVQSVYCWESQGWLTGMASLKGFYIASETYLFIDTMANISWRLLQNKSNFDLCCIK